MKNTVELLGYYGGDITHALSAWTSTSRDLDDSKMERIGSLLSTLAKNNHNTPFEKSTLHFYVVCENASHIQMLKHRVGVSINAESARYKELKDDKYYTPEDWPENTRQRYSRCVKIAYSEYHSILSDLEEAGFSRKRAKESARFALPYGNQLGLDISFNWRSFSHFLKLRNSEEAQVEIREIASEMLNLVKNIEGNPFEHTIRAFGL